MTLDGLAVMIKQSFDEVEENLHDLRQGQISLEKGQISLESGQVETHKRLAALEDGQEQIKLRQDNVAYRFEINELSQRVDRIEHKLSSV